MSYNFSDLFLWDGTLSAEGIAQAAQAMAATEAGVAVMFW
jgi:hypothetical protein